MAEGPIAALPQQVRENSRRIAELRDEIRELRRSVIRMEQRWGLDHENMAADLMPRFWLRRVSRCSESQWCRSKVKWIWFWR
jgi:hypothetical protein